MSSNPGSGPSRGASVPMHLSRRQRRANYVPGNNAGSVSRGGYNPRGGYIPGGGYGGPGTRGNFVGPRGGANRGFAPRGNLAFRGAPRGAARGRGGGAPVFPNVVKKPKQHTVATWTVQVGEVVYSYVSRVRWRDQARPLCSMAPESVPDPFKGRTLTDRHPNEPKAVYTEEELEELCPTCGTRVIHWDTHKASKLHEEKLQKPAGVPAEPTQMDVVAALRVLQATRPDIIAASLASSSRDGEAGPSRGGYRGGGDYGPSRDGYDSPGDDYERSRDGYERSRDDYERSRDGYERSRYDYEPSPDGYRPSDDDFGRSRDGFRPLDAMADEDLDGVPADHLDDLFPPMRGRSPDDDLYMPPAKFPRGMPPDNMRPPSSFFWN